MDLPYPAPNQVGAYFVENYYNALQNNPSTVYQFFSDDSIMLRIDGDNREVATSLLLIHQLVTSVNYTDIEIKGSNSLRTLHGSVLVTVYGSLVRGCGVKRQFVETFVLATKEKGFYVLNDILQFIEEEPIYIQQHIFVAPNNLESKFNDGQATNYLVGGDIQARGIVATNEGHENDAVDNCGFLMQQMQLVHDSERIQEDVAAEESYGSLQPTTNAVQNHVPSAEEPLEEPPKHTYASILRAKGQATPSEKSVSSWEWDHVPLTNSQQITTSTNAFERSETDLVEEVPATENKSQFENKSIYVRNLSPTVSAPEIEEEFKRFGRILPGGVSIRVRQDVGICFAFIEFEDVAGAHNAIKAGFLEVGGRQVHIEERRLLSNTAFRGRGRGRGRSSFHSEAPRGRFGARSLSRGRGRGQDGTGRGHDETGRGYDGTGRGNDGIGRGNDGTGRGQSGVERDYTKPRGNGFYRPITHQEREY